MRQHRFVKALVLLLEASLVALGPTQLLTGRPLWVATTSHWVNAILVAAFVVGAILARRQRDVSGRVRWLAALAIVTAAFVPALLFVAILTPDYSRAVLLFTMAVGIGLSILPLLLPRAYERFAIGVGVFGLVSLLVLGRAVEDGDGWNMADIGSRLAGPSTEIRLVTTNLYTLKATIHRNHIEREVRGGGLARRGESYLVADGSGFISYFESDPAKGVIESRRLALQIPVNPEPYLAQAIPEAWVTWFRVTDLLIDDLGDSVALYAVHNFWNVEEACGVLRVSVLEAPWRAIVSDQPPSDWRTVYDTTPCRALETEQQGGRLVLMGDGALLLSVGDHGFDGMRRPEIVSQDPKTAYGKTIRIDPESGRNEVYTLGHRNPQGLLVSRAGAVWLTEHGPNGGDELNRLTPGANYGWPLVTLGTDYHGIQLPSDAMPGSHAGFERPVFSWVPSIGISNLIEVSGDRFPLWQDDLIITSLARNALWRVRLREGKVVYTEPIDVGERVRDVIKGPDGGIVLWTDSHSLIFVEPVHFDQVGHGLSTEMMGKALFATCRGCHRNDGSGGHGIGPDLGGLIGRPIGQAKGYEYSPALRSLDGVWTVDRLETFLEDPQSFAPGNRMDFPGIANEEQRRAIGEYLQLN